MSSKHRIGFDLDSPIRIMGLTYDEVVLFVMGLGSFMFSSNKALGGVLMGIFMVLLMLVKRFKKRVGNFNIKSFMWWHFGLNFGHSTLPPSSTRKIN